MSTLVAALRFQHLLLVIDNAEHVSGAAPIFVELLAQIPRLTLLITSRVVLHLSGEHVYPLQPLSMTAAVQLFNQRVGSADPLAAFDLVQQHAIWEICERLEGSHSHSS